LDRDGKKAFVTEMSSRLKKAKATFLVDYQGLNVDAMNRLRSELKKVDAEFQVVKNRLLKLASRGTETESIKGQFMGPCALAITYDDMVAPAKVLVNLSKEFKQLSLKTGQISGKPLSQDAIKRLAELPGRDQLIAQVLSAMQGVPTSLVRTLNAIPLKLLYALKAIENSKNIEK
jgi:large subunit ribosomal protein L10